nr:hypothetical protein [Tanacetum cinerariifolium]
MTDCHQEPRLTELKAPKVPVSLPKVPYEAIRQAYLDRTDTESDPFEDPIDTETPELPLTIAPPTSLLKSALPTLVPILRRIAHMVVSFKCSPSLSPPDLPLRKRYRHTFELVKDSEEDDEEEDEEIEESLDSDSVSEDAKDEGPTAEDEDLATRDEGLAARVEGPGTDDERHGMDDKSHGLDDEGHSVESDGIGLEEEEEVVPGAQQQVASVVGTAVNAPLGLGYGALRHWELASEDDHEYNTFEFGQGSGSPPEFERPERVSASRQPTLTTWTDPEDGMVYIDERRLVVMALEAWVGRVDTRMTDMLRVGYDDHRLVHDILLQQTALQRELQEMRGRVTAFEQERDRRER